MKTKNLFTRLDVASREAWVLPALIAGLNLLPGRVTAQTFTTLHRFTTVGNYCVSTTCFLTNSDGANPMAGLVLSGNALYGTAYAGGSGVAGTVFAINTNGSGFTNLHSFTAPSTTYYLGGTNSDGALPRA